ncbi:MAG: hypothetical protein RJA70_1460 [Pseudomonadota bacterium]
MLTRAKAYPPNLCGALGSGECHDPARIPADTTTDFLISATVDPMPDTGFISKAPREQC